MQRWRHALSSSSCVTFEIQTTRDAASFFAFALLNRPLEGRVVLWSVCPESNRDLHGLEGRRHDPRAQTQNWSGLTPQRALASHAVPEPFVPSFLHQGPLHSSAAAIGPGSHLVEFHGLEPRSPLGHGVTARCSSLLCSNSKFLPASRCRRVRPLRRLSFMTVTVSVDPLWLLTSETAPFFGRH